MKKVAVIGMHRQLTTIEAPEGKDMVFDPSLLAHGILVLGEYGPSGVKIAAFKDWETASFLPDGYTITRA